MTMQPKGNKTSSLQWHATRLKVCGSPCRQNRQQGTVSIIHCLLLLLLLFVLLLFVLIAFFLQAPLMLGRGGRDASVTRCLHRRGMLQGREEGACSLLPIALHPSPTSSSSSGQPPPPSSSATPPPVSTGTPGCIPGVHSAYSAILQ